MAPISLHWFLPTASDSRGIVGGGHGASIQATQTLRGPRLPYLVQVA